MKKVQSLLTIALLAAASHLPGQTADNLVAAGRALLATNDDAAAYANLPAAYADFNAAVGLSPNHEAANVLVAATRLALLPQQAGASNALNRLGVSAHGRDVFNWTAHFQTNNSGQVVLPANLNSAEAIALCNTNLLPAIRASLTNLNRITNRAFTLSLTTDETRVQPVTLDWGDIELMRVGLHAAEFAGHTLNAHNLSVVITHLQTLGNAKPSQLTVQKVLADYPSLFALISKSELDASKAELTNAILSYLAASDFIRNDRQPGVGLFELLPEEEAKEAIFRDALTNALASLDHPVMVVSNNPGRVYGGAYFAGSKSLRSLLPQFSANRYVSNSLPDYTLGGTLLDEPAYFTEALLRKELAPTPYAGIYTGQCYNDYWDVDGGFALFVSSGQQAILVGYGYNQGTGIFGTAPVTGSGGWFFITNGVIAQGTIQHDGSVFGMTGDTMDFMVSDWIQGNLSPEAGAFQSAGGYYAGTSSGAGGTGKLSAILSADGQLYYCHSDSSGQPDDGGSGQLDDGGRFSSSSMNGTEYSGALTNTAIKATIAGTFTSAAGIGKFTLTRSAYIPQDTPPTITSAPRDQIGTSGSNLTFKVVAAGSPPLCYQWSVNGVSITGATSSSLVLSNLQPTIDPTNYSVAVQNIAGSNSASANLVRVIPEAVPPTVTITAPKSGQLWSNAVFCVTGTAKDNVQVSNVLCQLNNGGWEIAIGTSNWTNCVVLTPGTNLFRVYAVDRSGNVSPTNSVKLVYVLSAPLVVQTSGLGTVTPNYNGALLQISNTYKMTAKAGQGFAFTNWTGSLTTNSTVLTFVMASNLTFRANFLDVTKPTLTIASPTANQRWSNAVFTVKGTAKDNMQVSRVWCLTNGVWGLAAMTNGSANWSVDVSLAPRTNFVQAYAEDAAGNRSATNSVKLIYVVSDRLKLITTGKGTVSPNYSNAVIEIGTTNTLTATAGAGYVFSNWMGSVLGTLVLSNNTPKLTFVMRSNLVLQANIISNPFLALMGSYYGLVYDQTNTNGVQQASAGFFSGTLGSAGAFSAKLLLGGRTNTFTGQFDLGGHLAQMVPQTGSSPLALDLQLGPDTLSGTVSNAAWVSTLDAYRAVFNATTNPCPYAGRYTMAIPGEAGGSGCPDGSGYGSVTVDKAGNAVMIGALAEGTVMGQTVPVSKDGDWPLYVPLYSGQGSLIAWLRFTPSAGLTNTAATWIKPTNSLSKYYPAGFTNLSEIAGSSYLYVKTNRVLALTNGVMVFSGGNLAMPVTNEVLLTATNRFLNLSANPMAVTVNTNNGYLSGWFKVPGLGKTNQFNGVLLQEQNGADGYFLGTNQSGRVQLWPAP